MISLRARIQRYHPFQAKADMYVVSTSKSKRADIIFGLFAFDGRCSFSTVQNRS
jgi:hypothetical protein